MRRSLIERIEKLHVLFPALDRPAMYDLAMSFWTPWEIERLLGTNVRPRPRVDATCFADQMARCDLRHYLPDDILVKVDRTTMATGLEGREPLLDHRLAEFAFRLPLALRRGSLGTKHLLRRILYRHIPRELLERPKQGFAIPLSKWLRGSLAWLIDEYLAPSRVKAFSSVRFRPPNTRVKSSGLLDPDEAARAVRNFRDGGPANDRLDVQKVWLLLAFEMWRSRWLGQGVERTGVVHARAVHY